MKSLKLGGLLLVLLFVCSCSHEEFILELDTTKFENKYTYKRVISIKGRKVFLLDYLDPFAATLRTGKMRKRGEDFGALDLDETTTISLKTGDKLNLKRSTKAGEYSLTKNADGSYWLKRIDGFEDRLENGPFIIKPELSAGEYEILKKLRDAK